MQALSAAGRNPDGVKRKGSRSPVAYLESLIAPDGSVRYSRTGAQTPVWVTAQALTALARRSFPIDPIHAHKATHAAALRAVSALIGALHSSALGLRLSAAL